MELTRRDVGSFFIIISSHGLSYEVSLTGKDECICVIEDLMLPFSDNNFPEYEGRPKVFMPITCQDFGKKINQKKDGPSLGLLNGYELYDMVLCFPCLPGYPQERMHKRGTIFVNWLAYCLTKYAKKWDFVEILREVGRIALL